MIYRPYKVWRNGILTECWEPGPFIYDEKAGLFHRLDCQDVNARDSRKSVFLKSLCHLHKTTAKACPKCGPKSKDAYRQCLVCGTFIPTDRGPEKSTCVCEELTLDLSNPKLIRVMSKDNKMLSRHVGKLSTHIRVPPIVPL